MTFVRLKHRANRGPPEADPLDFDNFGDVTGKLIFGSGVLGTIRTSVRRSITALEGPMSTRADLAGLRLTQAVPRRTSPTHAKLSRRKEKKKVGGKLAKDS